MFSRRFRRESIVCVNQSSSGPKLFGSVMLLVHWCGLATPPYAFLDGSVAGRSTFCLASWKGMLFWKFILRISFSVFQLGQILLYAGRSPSQFAHFCFILTFLILITWLSAFAYFCSFLQNLLLWPYFWQLKHRCGFGIYTFFCSLPPGLFPYNQWVKTYYMMTSSNGNIFRVTGHLCGEFTDPRWIPHTKASDAELWCLLWYEPE